MTVWLVRSGWGNDKGNTYHYDTDREPVSTVCASGCIAGGGDYYLIDDGKPAAALSTRKPPYKVPSMLEVADVRGTNGYKVASTFSGCGGSCLGFEMAGYDVRFASEFIPSAQDTYRANHPGVHLDTRDIREVEPEQILEIAGVAKGELDVFEGSPPCASFSMAGSRDDGWGKIKTYSGRKQRTDDLFWEYARLVDGIKPKVFVAENVSGLVRGVAKGYFRDILEMFKGLGYHVEARLVDAQWLGVPQARQRIIFMGVRDDLGVYPVFPKPWPYRYSIRDACPWIVRAGTAPPLDEWRASGRSIDATMKDASTIPSSTITTTTNEGTGWCEAEDGPGDLTDSVESLRGTCVGEEWQNVPVGGASDKYYQIKKSDPENPSFTITAAGGTKCAGPVHPFERRKFTIHELKRLCAFPDDFNLLGSYAQQWERLGRSVPPLMMRAIASTIRDEVLPKCSR